MNYACIFPAETDRFFVSYFKSSLEIDGNNSNKYYMHLRREGRDQAGELSLIEHQLCLEYYTKHFPCNISYVLIAEASIIPILQMVKLKLRGLPTLSRATQSWDLKLGTPKHTLFPPPHLQGV